MLNVKVTLNSHDEAPLHELMTQTCKSSSRNRAIPYVSCESGLAAPTPAAKHSADAPAGEIGATAGWAMFNLLRVD
jgi:hypothetical protein